MMRLVRIDDHFTVGKDAPTEESLAALAEQGFKSVVNLATRHEDMPLSSDREDELCQAHGMQYASVPVDPDNLGPGLVDRFRDVVSRLRSPVLVHCASGARSGAFTLMHLAAEEGMSVDDALRKGERLGLELEPDELERLLRGYVEGRNRSTSAAPPGP